ncbi:Nicotinate phosphoribosyltransferase pncB2 [bioreactor metagenome]|jgi:nicotinate phosphoribosyltransferase|uniref:nicotinate phosphoribosyltransferase n=1 Tax=bioreactor metagenome TaxID=1076179 RepID=A0A644X6F1_9ZZZZ|nr:nicotinate phosphoribosyltransferase [Sedimentibacter saalensis]MEA5095831.1 nicotinate phosphoribosyltransferase [Sedimentibacter saalensis]
MYYNNFGDRKLPMLMDFYELTMANGYFANGMKDDIVYFDMFFRKNPDGAGFSIVAGLEQVIQYIKELKFNDHDIEYLRSKNMFKEEFLQYLKNFKFSGDIYAIPEGTPVFPNEPLITVRAKSIDAQLIETMLLLTINHQSLIATKANRVVRAAKGRPIMEFGARRSQGYDGAIYGARAAYIGGVVGTATTLADEAFGVPALGTMAHSWVQMYESEYEAFKVYAENYPDSCTLLIDTYNVIKSGIPNAIRISKEILEPMGKRLKGVRIDSGDIAYLSKKCRKMLNEANLHDCAIVASNSLDEFIITDLLDQGAKIDSFGVGERLITAKSEPVFGCVYKLAAIEKNGEIIPKIKISENEEKITNPGYKKVWRLYDKKADNPIADVVALHNEVIDDTKPYTIFDEIHVWKKKKVTRFYAKNLQVPVFIGGECVYESPSLNEIRDYCKKEVDNLWNEVKRFTNPHTYYVDLSSDLWICKQDLIGQYSFK